MHIWWCVGPWPVPRGGAGLKSGLIKFLVRCEGENKMGQRVKYCTALHFARGKRRQAGGGRGEPVCSCEFYEEKEARSEDLSAICFPQIGAILAAAHYLIFVRWEVPV